MAAGSLDCGHNVQLSCCATNTQLFTSALMESLLCGTECLRACQNKNPFVDYQSDCGVKTDMTAQSAVLSIRICFCLQAQWSCQWASHPPTSHSREQWCFDLGLPLVGSPPSSPWLSQQDQAYQARGDSSLWHCRHSAKHTLHGCRAVPCSPCSSWRY